MKIFPDAAHTWTLWIVKWSLRNTKSITERWPFVGLLYDVWCHILQADGQRCALRTEQIIRYDSVYLTCSKKLTGSQLSLPHGTNKKIKMWNWKQNDARDRSGLVPLLWGSPVGKRNLRWERFVEKVGFEPGVKEWRSDGWREWGWWQKGVDKWMSRWIEQEW